MVLVVMVGTTNPYNPLIWDGRYRVSRELAFRVGKGMSGNGR